MLEDSEHLIKMGISRAIFNLIEQEKLFIHPDSYIGKIIGTVSFGNSSQNFNKLLALDISLDRLLNSEHFDWAKSKFIRLTQNIKSSNENLEVNSLFAAEIIAAGLLLAVFPETKPFYEFKCGNKSPDFILGRNTYTEVYCPQKSKSELIKVENKLVEQNGFVKAVISYPLIGSDGQAKVYQTNKFIDKILNKKRTIDQSIIGAENILWIDLLNGFELSMKDTVPYTSINFAEHTFVGSLGVWHSFYGQKDVSLFAHERTDLKFSDSFCFYKQKRNGLFRERPALSAAILFAVDGIAIFENPWATVHLSMQNKISIKKIFRFRPEYSYIEFSNQKLLISQVEEILLKIQKLYQNEA